MVTVNEPGLYCLILRSRKPEARDFTRWVTHEVLPALRRTGNYQMPQEHFVEKKLVKFSRRELILLAIEVVSCGQSGPRDETPDGEQAP